MECFVNAVNYLNENGIIYIADGFYNEDYGYEYTIAKGNFTMMVKVNQYSEYYNKCIPIPECFSLFNTSKNQSESNIYRLYFDKLGDEKVPADECTHCGTCLDYCTQKIDIPDELEKVVEHFQEGFSPYE